MTMHRFLCVKVCYLDIILSTLLFLISKMKGWYIDVLISQAYQYWRILSLINVYLLFDVAGILKTTTLQIFLAVLVSPRMSHSGICSNPTLYLCSRTLWKIWNFEAKIVYVFFFPKLFSGFKEILLAQIPTLSIFVELELLIWSIRIQHILMLTVLRKLVQPLMNIPQHLLHLVSVLPLWSSDIDWKVLVSQILFHTELCSRSI